ncbi:hypothetical protein ABZX92_07040 [Lentzea sp. NPDC006480]|uniref:hypothetical protein n=1 Tax=Lentzea sp. NPDC006480 TaxID=3157176 RepID=UPI0033BB7FC5
MIIALIAAAELGCTGLVIGVAASAGTGMASTVTVSIDGVIGTWAPASTQSSTAAPATTGTTVHTPVAPTDPPPDQPIAPTTPSTSETTPAPAGTAPGDAPSSSSEPQSTTP